VTANHSRWGDAGRSALPRWTPTISKLRPPAPWNGRSSGQRRMLPRSDRTNVGLMGDASLPLPAALVLTVFPSPPTPSVRALLIHRARSPCPAGWDSAQTTSRTLAYNSGTVETFKVSARHRCASTCSCGLDDGLVCQVTQSGLSVRPGISTSVRASLASRGSTGLAMRLSLVPRCSGAGCRGRRRAG
jgi:hypothetical protein